MAEWRDIKGYEGYYQVSDEGEVRSVDRYDNRGERLKGKIRKQNIDKYGYKVINLNMCGIKKRHLVHRLVAQAFIENDDPEHKTQCNHINECKQDNRASNLEWCDNKYNQNYGTRTKRGLKTKLEKGIINIIHKKSYQQAV